MLVLEVATVGLEWNRKSSVELLKFKSALVRGHRLRDEFHDGWRAWDRAGLDELYGSKNATPVPFMIDLYLDALRRFSELPMKEESVGQG